MVIVRITVFKTPLAGDFAILPKFRNVYHDFYGGRGIRTTGDAGKVKQTAAQNECETEEEFGVHGIEGCERSLRAARADWRRYKHQVMAATNGSVKYHDAARV